MQITITRTDHLVFLDGVHCRVWEGVTDSGTPCAVFVHRIMGRTSDDRTELDENLYEVLSPRVLSDSETPR